MTDDPLLTTALNLARFHREHEKFYAAAPLEESLALQRSSLALKALADRWSESEPSETSSPSPYAGAEDLNDERAIEQAGILFMEGEGEPAEIGRIKGDLRDSAKRSLEGADWLAKAMESSWVVAAQAIRYPELADVLGERHRIIVTDWQNAETSRLIGRLLDRAADILDAIDFTPAALRADLAAGRRTAAYLYSATELIDRAADLLAESAVLVHENERRWRVFRARVAEVTRDRQAS